VRVSVPSNGAVPVPSTAVEPAVVNSMSTAPASVPVPSTLPPRQRLVSA
jgi:hypothetical protein